jgi:hypothetical protein
MAKISTILLVASVTSGLFSLGCASGDSDRNPSDGSDHTGGTSGPSSGGQGHASGTGGGPQANGSAGSPSTPADGGAAGDEGTAHDGGTGGFDRPSDGGAGGANGATSGESSGLGGAATTIEGGSAGSTGDTSAGGASETKFARTVSFADNDFYSAPSGGPLGTESYVYAAILRASEGTTAFTSSVEIWRKGATARGWTFSRLSGTSVRFRHHDAAGVVRGTSVPIQMDHLNLVVFTFDGATACPSRRSRSSA